MELERAQFENDVKTYGTQAIKGAVDNANEFENDVKTYGTQAFPACELFRLRLRMM